MIGNSSLLGARRVEGSWEMIYCIKNKVGARGKGTLKKARDPEVGSAANLSKAWEISLQNERGREEHQK